ncbi:DUF4231 domain-containing protein [Streptococcus thoraltensis]|uniref:DUF4231 domain-containing protein n=1 Tax=Streptococcus thoraltensis TaxID=55085 RepID=UPI0003715E2C|nr:DUF4231 domain-containing protein [Streptococcus thoraltensis]QBX31146.1 hypothetical protein Javan616_0053 [Streptococcus phage Javan616]
MDEQEYLESRLYDQIKWYDTKSQDHQKRYKCLKRIEVILGFIIPILTTARFPFFEILSALCAGGMLLCESFISISKHRDNWIDYRRTAELLKQEKHMFLTKTGVYKNEPDAFALLVERAETIISSENINWANLQTDTAQRKE